METPTTPASSTSTTGRTKDIETGLNRVLGMIAKLKKSGEWRIGPTEYRRRAFHLTPGQKNRKKAAEAQRRLGGQSFSDCDPLMEDILRSARTKRKSRRNRRSGSFRHRRNQQRPNPGNSANRRYRFENTSADPSRGSMLIIRYADIDPVTGKIKEGSPVLFNFQRDTQKDRFNSVRPKSGYGFVVGGPDEKNEPDEKVANREGLEETGTPQDLGVMEHVGNFNASEGEDYYIAVFIKTVPFDTPNTPGEEIHIENGNHCQVRVSREQVIDFIDNGVKLPNFQEAPVLRNHAQGWKLAMAAGKV